MRKIENTVNAPSNGHSLTFQYEEPENLEEAISHDGEAIVFEYYIRSRRVALQGAVRDRLKADTYNEDETLQMIDEWKPNLKGDVKPENKLMRLIKESKIPQDELDALLEKYSN